MDRESSHQLHVVDLGLAVPYLDDSTGIHVPAYTIPNSLVGTARYASLNSHKGMRLSRRDDLESATYVLLLLVAGRLPWPETASISKQHIAAIYRAKKACDFNTFCCEVQVPLEFGQAISYARQLSYDEEPNYQYLREIYRRISQAATSDSEDIGGSGILNYATRTSI